MHGETKTVNMAEVKSDKGGKEISLQEALKQAPKPFENKKLPEKPLPEKIKEKTSEVEQNFRTEPKKTLQDLINEKKQSSAAGIDNELKKIIPGQIVKF